MIDATLDNFEQECFVNLMMYDFFKNRYFCVYETIKTFVVPPEKWTWDNKVFTLQNSYTEDDKTILIYHPVQVVQPTSTK